MAVAPRGVDARAQAEGLASSAGATTLGRPRRSRSPPRRRSIGRRPVASSEVGRRARRPARPRRRAPGTSRARPAGSATPTIGRSSATARPLASAIATRRPVKEPGPVPDSDQPRSWTSSRPRRAQQVEQARQQLGRLALRRCPGIVRDAALRPAPRSRSRGRSRRRRSRRSRRLGSAASASRACAAPDAPSIAAVGVDPVIGVGVIVDLEPIGRKPAGEPIGPLDDDHALGPTIVEQARPPGASSGSARR